MTDRAETAGETKVAVVGLGGMGSGIAHSILRAGFPVTVFNRTPGKADELVGAGAVRAGSAAEAGADADVVVLSLAGEPSVDEVLFGHMSSRIRPGTTIIDTTTVSPAYARSVTLRLAAAGIPRVEACVIGNPKMAKAGELRVYTAGEKSHVDGVGDLLAAFGKEIRYLGEAGAASVLKLSFNLLLGIQTAGLAEAVVFAEKAGLGRQQFLSVLENSAWRSPVLNFRAELMRDGAYRPAAFRSALMHKDLLLAREEAEAHRVGLGMVEAAADVFGKALESGRGDEDAAVVVELVGQPRREPGPVLGPSR
ncbi:NAD(P)-dependent oxidoreductase [Amycolatopsis sp. NPDC059021]|uniref:NAD(P)-dependent oxidoreductase n=1 Tax=Amycolatopsis sp. NPDC059021 TaxID=3346704 RepID=UPI0036734723